MRPPDSIHHRPLGWPLPTNPELYGSGIASTDSVIVDKAYTMEASSSPDCHSGVALIVSDRGSYNALS